MREKEKCAGSWQTTDAHDLGKDNPSRLSSHAHITTRGQGKRQRCPIYGFTIGGAL